MMTNFFPFFLALCLHVNGIFPGVQSVQNSLNHYTNTSMCASMTQKLVTNDQFHNYLVLIMQVPKLQFHLSTSHYFGLIGMPRYVANMVYA